MLMRKPLAPAASNASSVAGSREAGPRVAKILALLIIFKAVDCQSSLVHCLCYLVAHHKDKVKADQHKQLSTDP
jgi:hypothetical protein